MIRLTHVLSQSNETQQPTHLEDTPKDLTSTRKRKRDGPDGINSGAVFVQRLFTLTPCSEFVRSKPYNLEPIAIIPRSKLPLSSLDLLSNASYPNGLFESEFDLIQQPENSASHRPSTEPLVLIARLNTNESLCAIELVRKRIYGLCKLAPWFSESDVRRLSASRVEDNLPSQHRAPNVARQTSSWWQNASLAERNIDATKPKPKPHGPRLLMLHASDTFDHTAKSPGELPRSLSQAVLLDTLPVEPDMGTLDADQTFDAFVMQYLETLYLSRTSLAYLAKGPLSRARVAFSNQIPTMRPYDLTTKLRDMLLTIPSMDKKYKSRLPEILHDVHLDDVSDKEDATKTISVLLKRGKSKKRLKPGRNGMYPREEQIVKQWWKFHDTALIPGERIEAAITRRTAELRQREISAQLILLLEVLSLEAVPGCNVPPEASNQIGEAALQPTDSTRSGSGKVSKVRKPQDLKLLMEILLDKLCIWQSVEHDLAVKDYKSTSSASPTTVKSTNDDVLRGFCTEVIIPFYISRLPEHVAAINRKLGGPKVASPLHKSSRSNAQKKPGAPETRAVLSKTARHSLGRVATETAQRDFERPPSLVRSATDSALIPGLKVERSETPLSRIPLQRSPSVTSRSAVSQYQRFASREVDLTAMSAATTARKRRKEAIDLQLKEAITTLKKPNRGLAVKEFADSADRRNQPIGSKGKKAALQSVQVSATPKRARMSKDSGVAPSLTYSRVPIEDNAVSSTSRPSFSYMQPPSSSVVPGTIVKSRSASALRAHQGTRVEETPSRGPLGKTVVFQDTEASMSTPYQTIETPSRSTRSINIPEFTPRPPIVRALFQVMNANSRAEQPNDPRAGGIDNNSMTVFATPVKGQAEEGDVPCTPNVAQMEKARLDSTPQTNLYDMLGWNDDEADELAFK